MTKEELKKIEDVLIEADSLISHLYYRGGIDWEHAGWVKTEVLQTIHKVRDMTGVLKTKREAIT